MLPSLSDQLHRRRYETSSLAECECRPLPRALLREPQLPSVMVFSQSRVPTYRSYVPARPWGAARFTSGYAGRRMSVSEGNISYPIQGVRPPSRPSPTSVHSTFDMEQDVSEDDHDGILVKRSPATNSKSRSSRYLRELDRRTILARIANGEKQSALAREYNVSRSTICNLNKQRDRVLARTDENPFSRHPKTSRAQFHAS